LGGGNIPLFENFAAFAGGNGDAGEARGPPCYCALGGGLAGCVILCVGYCEREGVETFSQGKDCDRGTMDNYLKHQSVAAKRDVFHGVTTEDKMMKETIGQIDQIRI